jgi:hypothetical protein
MKIPLKEIKNTCLEIANQIGKRINGIIDIDEFEQIICSLYETYCVDYDIYDDTLCPLSRPYFKVPNLARLYDVDTRSPLFEEVTFVVCEYYDYSISVKISLYDMFHLNIEECYIHS